MPTLKQIAARNPQLVCLGNRSVNFQMDQTLRGLGFSRVIPLDERTPLRLSDTVMVTRYPTTGIDNMLLMKATDLTILNFNDCNIPLRARRQLAKRLGRLDVFMGNFNHAGKLFEWPPRDAGTIKRTQRQQFAETYTPFSPTLVVPFASYHRYRAPESVEQNASLLDVGELVSTDPRIMPLPVGGVLTMSDTGNTRIDCESDVERLMPDVLNRPAPTDFDVLRTAADRFRARLCTQTWQAARRVPPLYVEIVDLKLRVRLSIRDGLTPSNVDPQIVAHSHALFQWWTQEYGTDNFVVGAHFAIAAERPIALRWLILLGLLGENRVDLRSLAAMMRSARGRRFLWNRREEIAAIVRGRRFLAARPR